MDGVNPWGPTRDIAVVGLGNSTLDDVLRKEAESRQRTITPEPEPEKGSFYRSDHFEFARQGVPALYVQTGTEFLGKSPGYAKQKRDEYVQRDYHKVTDEVKPDWDLSGTIEDLRLLFLTGFRVAQDREMPAWKPGTEFKAKREQMLARH
jgi:Zn-dependent M28 family amino/carboxypeptidase